MPRFQREGRYRPWRRFRENPHRSFPHLQKNRRRRTGGHYFHLTPSGRPHNANTRSRYIYIHGTNDTELLGTPASHGCIRLSPRDMMALFALAEEGMDVFIQC